MVVMDASEDGRSGGRSLTGIVLDDDVSQTARQLTIDEALAESIGDFGRRQQWAFSMASMAWLPGAFVTLSMSFAGKDPVMLHLWECVDVQDAACRSAFEQSDPTTAFCALSTAQWRWTVPEESIISDFGIQCGEEWRVQVANSAYFMGFLFGSSLWGVLSDNIGRRPSMMLSCATAAISCALTALAPNWLWYLFLRMITGLLASGMGIVSFVLATEIVGQSWRGEAAIATQLFWALGECLLPWLAHSVPAWRSLMLASGASTLCMLLFWPLIPESPRWLLTQGRTQECWAALKSLADGNGTSMPHDARLLETRTSTSSATLMDTFRIPVLRRRQLIMLYTWCVVSLGYYGVSMALDALGGDIYLNFFLVSVIEFPSYIISIMLVNVVGRKPLTLYSFALCGVACLLCAFTNPGAVRTALAVAGKFGAAIAFIILFLYTTELFPTVVRNAALGSNSSAARVGGMLAPAVVLLAKEVHAAQLSFVIFGALSVIAAVVTTLLPETMNRPLLETFDDVEHEADDRLHPKPDDRVPIAREDSHTTGSLDGMILPDTAAAQTHRPPRLGDRWRLFQGWNKLDERS